MAGQMLSRPSQDDERILTYTTDTGEHAIQPSVEGGACYNWKRSEVIGDMPAQLVDTVTFADLRAEIYSTDLPGEFKIIYRDSKGQALEEAPLTDISSYKQRQPEILARLQQLKEGAKTTETPDRGDAGEY